MTVFARNWPRLPPQPGTTRAGDGMPRRKWTARDLQRMLEAGIIDSGERSELLGGDVVALSAKERQHEAIKIALNNFWARARPPEVGIAPETPLRLDEHPEPEPDLIVYPASLLAPDVRGDTVLPVVEIAASTLPCDHGIKAPMYAAHGARDCWVLDATRRHPTIYRQPAPSG